MDQEPKIDLNFLFMRMRYWWYIVLFAQMFLLIFLVNCLGAARWVRQGEGAVEWEGSLVMVTTTYVNGPDRDTYGGLADEFCDKDGDLFAARCATFEDLDEAAGMFIFLAILTIAFLLVWMLRVVFVLMGRELLEEWMGLMWPWLGLFFHLMGIIIWSNVAGTDYGGDCEDFNDGDNRIDVCATKGPAMAIIFAILYLLVAGFYVVLFTTRKKLTS